MPRACAMAASRRVIYVATEVPMNRTRALIGLVVATLVLVAAVGLIPVARAADPIKIGLGMALTGGLSANGKPALLAMQIWKDDVNKKGGLLGRPVELIFYDDQTNPATVPGIYSKLLDVDKVDFIVFGYGTNLIAPLMPIAMERKLTLVGIFGLANNEKYKYPNYFQISPNGPDPEISTPQGFFELAAKQNPKPQTVAIVGADAEYPQNALVGARELIKKYGFKTVYDKTYPPSTVDYTPIVRAIKATNPDILYVASYPPDSVGILRAAHDLRRRHGGAHVHERDDEHGPAAQRHRQLRLLGARGAVPDHARHQGVPQGVPGARREGRRRSARLLPAALHVRGRSGPDPGHRGDQGARPAEARGLHPRHRVQHDRRQSEVRQERRVGEGAHAHGPVPEDPGQRHRPIPR